MFRGISFPQSESKNCSFVDSAGTKNVGLGNKLMFCVFLFLFCFVLFVCLFVFCLCFCFVFLLFVFCFLLFVCFLVFVDFIVT